MDKKIKEFFGNSFAKIYLMQDSDSKFYIKKILNKPQDVFNTVNIYNEIKKKGMKTPEIFSIKENFFCMEYINGLSIQSLLRENSIESQEKIALFIKDYFNIFDSKNIYDFSTNIKKKLNDISHFIEKEKLTFSFSELYKKIPKKLPINSIHGDITFDNILYFKDSFYLIDPSFSFLNSVFFEFNKLMQDIKSYWFARNIDYKTNFILACQEIEYEISSLIKKYYNPYIHIFMLLRIMPYSRKNKSDMDFLTQEVNRLWR